MTVFTSIYSKWNRLFALESFRIGFFALVGIVAFLFVNGTRTLDVTYTDWLMNGKDPTLHFLGWEFFRNDPWAFPLGKIASYGYPAGSSTTFTDSITLLALPFKLLNPWLPEKFQYFGLWTLFCFAMQGVFGGLLVSRVVGGSGRERRLLVFIGTLFFALSPVMLRPSHTALSGHWIILASLFLFFEAREKKISVFWWMTVQVLAALIMPYFTFMTVIIYVGHEIDDALKNKKIALNGLRLAAVLLSLVLTGWLIGLFDAGSLSVSRNQFGHYSMNLNALFNPMGWSGMIPALPTATNGQMAGFNYLGLGMMAVVAVSLGVSIYRRTRDKLSVPPGLARWGRSREGFGLLFIVVLLFAYSLSNKITFFDQMLVVPLPGKVLDVFAIFRSSGRMFWPVYYLIFLYAFRTLAAFSRAKNVQKATVIFLAAMLIVQIAEIAGSPLLKSKLAQRTETAAYRSPLRSAFWDDAGRTYRHIVFLPPKIDDYDAFSFFALKHRMTINTGYFARAHTKQIYAHANQLVNELKNGILDGNNLYIIKDPGLYHELSVVFQDKAAGYFYTIDDFDVLVARPYPEKAAGE